MTKPPLSGVRVVVPVTRDHRGLAARVAELGATVHEVAFIDVIPPADPTKLATAARAAAAGHYDWVAVTSRNGVAALANAAAQAALDVSGVRVAAVGAATARECVARGLVPELVSAGAGAAGLVEAFPAAPPDGGRVLAPLGQLAPTTLSAGLEAKGWHVAQVEAYRTVDGPGPGPDVVAALRAGEVDAVLATSASVARRLAQVWGEVADGTMVVAIGPTTSAAVSAAGLPVAAEAEAPTRDAMVAALAAAVQGKEAR